MGRWSWSNKRTVEECKPISISVMAQGGAFEKGLGNLYTYSWSNLRGEEVGSISYQVRRGPAGEPYLQLSYTITNRSTKEKTPLDYSIQLTTTPCNFGGKRYWFICPLVVNGMSCRRRVGKLYLPPNGKYFGCRLCYNLTYRSCQEHDSRVDALARNPELLLSLLKKKGWKGSPAELKAYFKATGRL